jgi:hypothetical protein
VTVVVLDKILEHCCKLALVEDRHPVQALPANGADETFGEGMGPWRPDRRADDPDALGSKDLVEAGRELGVSVPEQEPDRRGPIGEHEAQIPGLLSDPRPNLVQHPVHGRDRGPERIEGPGRCQTSYPIVVHAGLCRTKRYASSAPTQTHLRLARSRLVSLRCLEGGIERGGFRGWPDRRRFWR